MKRRKFTPEELALAVAQCIIAVERATATTDGTPFQLTDGPANGAQHTNQFSPYDVVWMHRMGIRLD
jgi:hypothetical protein